MKITQMTGRTGKPVANQFIIEDGDTTYFQSYDSIIAKTDGKTFVLDRDKWNYSPTTSKYLNKFLLLTPKEVKQKIKSGEIILRDLN